MRERFIKGRHGASCSRALKRDLLNGFLRHDDEIVLGLTADEQHRLDRIIDANSDLRVRAPLIERGLTKADCLAIVERAGIELPAMYRLGFRNANCIGCCKGGAGYWNKVRTEFPLIFARAALIEEAIGPSAYMLFDEATKERYPLRDLKPGRGRLDEPSIECGIFCEMAEREISALPLDASP